MKCGKTAELLKIQLGHGANFLTQVLPFGSSSLSILYQFCGPLHCHAGGTKVYNNSHEDLIKASNCKNDGMNSFVNCDSMRGALCFHPIS
jgi:hypothetical protein